VVDCSAAFDVSSELPVDSEGAVTIQVRYRDIPDLRCAEVQVVRDKTPPLVSVVFDPPFLVTRGRDREPWLQ